MNHIIDEYAGVIIGLIVSYSMINPYEINRKETYQCKYNKIN
jgi:hypothetical protein